MAAYGGFAPAVAEQAGAPDQLAFRALHWLLVPPPWHRGRTLLIGDARSCIARASSIARSWSCLSSPGVTSRAGVYDCTSASSGGASSDPTTSAWRTVPDIIRRT